MDTLKEVKNTIELWKTNGDSNIKVYRITTEEIGNDEIELDEELLALDN